MKFCIEYTYEYEYDDPEQPEWDVKTFDTLQDLIDFIGTRAFNLKYKCYSMQPLGESL